MHFSCDKTGANTVNPNTIAGDFHASGECSAVGRDCDVGGKSGEVAPFRSRLMSADHHGLGGRFRLAGNAVMAERTQRQQCGNREQARSVSRVCQQIHHVSIFLRRSLDVVEHFVPVVTYSDVGRWKSNRLSPDSVVVTVRIDSSLYSAGISFSGNGSPMCLTVSVGSVMS